MDNCKVFHLIITTNIKYILSLHIKYARIPFKDFLVYNIIRFLKMKKLKIQYCLARCWAILVSKTTLKTMENWTGSGSIVLSICQLCNPWADILTIISYLHHLILLTIDSSSRPKTVIDWVEESLLLLCTFISLLSLCGVMIPTMIVKSATIISLTLFSAAWQPRY